MARTSFTPTPPKGPWPRTVLVDRPGAAQTVFAFVAPGPTEADPAVPALRLANIPLGGSFTSRLNTNLREDKGYTYGVHSGLATARIAGRWGIRTSVESGVTSPALKELLKEVSGMAKDGPTSAELGKARASEKGDRVSSYESIEDMAHGLSALASMSLPADWDAQLARRTDTLPDTDVVAAAKGMSLQQATIVAVGDGTVIRAAFEAAGLPAPEVRDVDGRPATAGAPSPGVKK